MHVSRSENLGGQVVLGGDNVPPLVEIGLTDLPKTGGGVRPRTATGMDGTLPHCSFENLKPVEITKNLFQHHLNILRNV